MKIKDLKDLINSTSEWDEHDLKIEIALENSDGVMGTPAANIHSMRIGFDWDSGKFILGTKEKLCIKKEHKKL